MAEPELNHARTLEWARQRVAVPHKSPAHDAAAMLLEAEVVIRALLQLVKVSRDAGQMFTGPIELGGAGRNTVVAAYRWLDDPPWYCEGPTTCEGPCGECWAEVQ